MTEQQLPTFTLDLKGLPKVWRVSLNKVYEQLDHQRNDDDFSNEMDACEASEDKYILQMAKKYEHAENQSKGLRRVAHKVRCLYSRSFRLVYAEYLERVKKAEKAYYDAVNFRPEVIRIPDSVELVGYDLQLGQNIYVVDVYGYRAYSDTIIRREVSYYNFDKPKFYVNYTTASGKNFKQDLVSPYTNYQFFRDYEEAKEVFKKLCDDKIAEIWQNYEEFMNYDLHKRS